MGDAVIFEFSASSSIEKWTLVDDVVMGGKSGGDFFLSKEGFGVFAGTVSLENNGGFSSVRYPYTKTDLSQYTKIVIRLRGDKKNYQFRVKSKRSDYYSYTHTFSTNGDWQTIEIPFSALNPAFRGRSLQMPSYPAESIEEIAFLIGNKKNERFQLEIAKITLSN